MVLGNALGGVLLVLLGARGALVVNAGSFLVSAVIILRLRTSAAAVSGGLSHTVTGSLRAGAANLFGDRMVRRALTIIVLTGALGTVDEASWCRTRDHVGLPDGFLGLLAAAIPLGTLIGTAVIARSTDHHALLRSAALCAAITAAAAAPLFWFEVGGPGAFLAFVISGGMFAVSIPTNVVIGTRCSARPGLGHGHRGGRPDGEPGARRCRGGVVASAVGAPRAIAGALALAAVFGAWATVTTPVEPKHLAGRRRGDAPGGGTHFADPTVVLDLVALEANQEVPFVAITPIV